MQTIKMIDDGATLQDQVRALQKKMGELERENNERAERIKLEEAKIKKGRLQQEVQTKLHESGCTHPKIVYKLLENSFWEDANGEFVGGDRKAPSTIEEVVDYLLVDDEFDIYFDKSKKKGGKDKEEARPEIYGKANPFEKGAAFNVTKAAQLAKSDPKLAKAFIAAAREKGTLGPGMDVLAKEL